jgi:hypothetical protein
MQLTYELSGDIARMRDLTAIHWVQSYAYATRYAEPGSRREQCATAAALCFRAQGRAALEAEACTWRV